MKIVNSLHENQIDGALRILAEVEPRSGFEERLLVRMASAPGPLTARTALPSWLPFSRRGQTRGQTRGQVPGSINRGRRLAFSTLAASLAGAAILIGSAIHTRRLGPPPVPPAAAGRGVTAGAINSAPAGSPQVFPTSSPTGSIDRVAPGGRGFGAASTGRLPAPGMHPRPYLTPRGRTMARPHQGRAVLRSTPSHPAQGSVRPNSPYGIDAAPIDPQPIDPE